MKELIDEIIMHQRETLKLIEKLEKRYGVSIINANPERHVFIPLDDFNYSKTYFNGARIHVHRGFEELCKELGGTIYGKGRHYSFIYDGCDIGTVTNGGKRFLKAKKRNNKYTRVEKEEKVCACLSE